MEKSDFDLRKETKIKMELCMTKFGADELYHMVQEVVNKYHKEEKEIKK